MTTQGVSRPSRVASVAPGLAARAAEAQRARRRRRVRRSGISLAVVAVLTLAGWVPVSSSLLAVQKIVVSGQARLSALQVSAVAQVPVGTPLARVDTSAVAARVRALRPVASVSVIRSWPHVLKIVVTERVVVAAEADSGTVHLVDGTGVVVADARTVPRGLPLLNVPAEGTTVPAALAVLEAVPPAVRSQVAKITAPTADAVSLDLRDGRRIIWGSPGTPTENGVKAAAVTALLKLPGRVFDVRAPGIATRR